MQIFLISVFTFLAFYGALHIVVEIVSGIVRKNAGEPCHCYTVITMKNREADVEGIVRGIAQRQLRLCGGGGNVPEIYAVDLDSTDRTYEILQKLELEYGFLKAMRKDEYLVEWVDNEWVG